jgi:hypothetical protein
MKRLAMFLSVALLTACQDKASPPGNAVAAGDPPAAPTAAARLTPGRYRQDTTLLALNDPTLAPAIAARAARAVGTTQSAEQCVTPDMIADPKELIASSIEGACTISRLTWEKGMIDVAFNCRDNRSDFAEATLTGSYTADAYAMELEMKDSSGKLAKLRVDATRVGDCN